MDDIGLGILVAWLIVSVVFGAIGAAMASEKGASGGAGFLVGFLFNAVGLIIVMLMSPSVEVEARRRIAVEREMGASVGGEWQSAGTENSDVSPRSGTAA